MKKYIESVERGEIVYFARSRATGLIKIGHSKDPERRLKHFEGASSEGIELLAKMPGGKELESELHRWFNGGRQKGEWYSPTQELVRFIWGVMSSQAGSAGTAPRPEPSRWTESASNQGAVQPKVLASTRIHVPQESDAKGKYPRRWLEDFLQYIGLNPGELHSMLNRYGEEVLVEAMHDYDRQVHKGTKPRNPAAYFNKIVENRATSADRAFAQFPEEEQIEISLAAWESLDVRGAQLGSGNLTHEIRRIVHERMRRT